MSYNYLFLENSNTLLNFYYLELLQYKPVLVLHGKRLILLSYEPKKISDYLNLFLMTIRTIALKIFSDLSLDQRKINKIKEKILNKPLFNNIRLEVCKKNPHFSKLSQEITNLKESTPSLLQKIDMFLKDNS